MPVLRSLSVTLSVFPLARIQQPPILIKQGSHALRPVFPPATGKHGSLPGAERNTRALAAVSLPISRITEAPTFVIVDPKTILFILSETTFISRVASRHGGASFPMA